MVGITETVIPDLTVLAGMIAITAVLDWRLTLVMLGVIPLYALTARLRNRSLRAAQQEARARSGDLAAIAADLLGRIPVIHLFDHADAEVGRYSRAGARSACASVAALDASARYSPFTDSLPGLGLAAALITGTIEVTSGRLTVGGLLVLLAYLSSLTAPVRSLARLSTTIAAGNASRERVAELLSLPCLQPDASLVSPAAGRPRARRTGSPAPARLGALRPGRGLPVSLQGVTFAHRADQPVLAGVNLHISGGELLCITGPSGAASQRCCRCSSGSRTRKPGASPSAGMTSPACPWVGCASWSRWSPRIPGCTPAPSPRTSATAGPVRPAARSWPPPKLQAWHRSPTPSQTATTLPSASTAGSCPAGSSDG